MSAKMAVGVVNYQDYGLLENCLRSVFNQSIPPEEVMVVDNSEQNYDPGPLLLKYPLLRWVRSSQNIGYSGGANEIIRRSVSEIVLILNPDVELTLDYIEKISKVFSNDPRAGVVGGKLLRPNGTIDSAGIVRDHWWRCRNRGEGEEDKNQYSGGDVFAICGAVIALRRTMLNMLKLNNEFFDEDFFAYREDVDLSTRARKSGWGVIYEPQIVALHGRNWKKGERRNMSRVVKFHSFKNRYLEIMKNESPQSFLFHFPWVAVYEMSRFFYVLFREPFLLQAYWGALRLFPKMWKKRKLGFF